MLACRDTRNIPWRWRVFCCSLLSVLLWPGIALSAERDDHAMPGMPLAEPDLLQPLPERGLDPWLVAGLALAAVLALLIGGWRLRKKKTGTDVAVPPDPSVTALASLHMLESFPLDDDCDFDAFYVALSRTLRKFITALFHEDAQKKITDEIRAFVSQAGHLSEECSQRLFMLLEQSDWVKFSTDNPFPRQAREDLAEAIVFVRNVAESLEAKQQQAETETGDDC